MESKPTNIDEYLATLEPDARATLAQLRRMIGTAVPEAVESIGYGMPTFKYMGRPLVHFAASKNHCALYGLVAAKDALRDELAGYDTSKGTLRFPRNEPPPEGLVRRLLAVRVKEIEAAEATRKSKKGRVPTNVES